MGRLLGSHDTEDLDRPDLNKCPECGSYFAPDAEHCPICGTHCPEEYRAGNRKPVKAKKPSFSRASSRVVFVEWYHSWWFIVLAMVFMPLLGVVLLITSPHKRSHKITFVVLALLYTVLVSWGVGGMLISSLRSQLNPPIYTAMPQEDYIAACETVDAEAFYRTPDTYTDRKIAVTLTVGERITAVTEDAYPHYYLCTDADRTFTVLVRDCIQGEHINLIPGDVVTIYGEGAGNTVITDLSYIGYDAPCIHAAYILITNQEENQ